MADAPQRGAWHKAASLDRRALSDSAWRFLREAELLSHTRQTDYIAAPQPR